MGANYIKTIIFQDFKEGIHLGWNVNQFLAELEETQELEDDDLDAFKTIADDV